jgi:hypothetical protein
MRQSQQSRSWRNIPQAGRCAAAARCGGLTVRPRGQPGAGPHTACTPGGDGAQGQRALVDLPGRWRHAPRAATAAASSVHVAQTTVPAAAALDLGKCEVAQTQL